MISGTQLFGSTSTLCVCVPFSTFAFFSPMEVLKNWQITRRRRFFPRQRRLFTMSTWRDVIALFQHGNDLRLATFRSGDDFRDQFLSIIGINLQQPSLRPGCLDIIGSSAGTHGHGEARGDAPARENDQKP